MTTTISQRVAAVSDECMFIWDGGAWGITTPTWNGEIGYQSASWLKLGYALRWTGITIPSGATIVTAYIIFKAQDAQVGAIVKSYFTGNKENNPAAFTTLANYQGRRGTVVGGANNTKITTAQVAWDSISGWSIDSTYQSPELKTIIQELVNAHAPTAEALVLFWDDHNDRSTHAANCFRNASSYQASAANAPLLHIEYNASSGPKGGNIAAKLLAGGML